jgi:UDP-N-acetylglucosamine--N-acetylmuramyl-(pentapeptide) pyrophosphoryl-undecaprenol N-acetylglucosamine transferase
VQAPLIVLAAGGTGGHLFPAEALSHALHARGLRVALITDTRAAEYAGSFPAESIHAVPAATPSGRSPLKMLQAALVLAKGAFAARRAIKALQPALVVGFGGYPTVPPLIAASNAGLPTLIHEQNAVMGRANKALSSRVTAIAGGFLPEGQSRHADKIVITGNPVRPAVIAAAETPYVASRGSEPFHLVVFGGSQGAQFFSAALPAAIALLPDDLKARLRLTQQARAEDEAGVRKALSDMGIAAEVSPFFTDMAARIAAAHLVISRSGASTVSEIAVIGRPSILVPYPHALDHDQAANAAALMAKDGATVIRQAELSPDVLAAMLAERMRDPDGLAATAAHARAAGKPDSATLLADLTEAIAGKMPISQYRSTRA